MMDNEELVREIKRLKKEKNAVILVHNYQRPEIYKVADFMGDSLELSRAAEKTDADVIIFCGVDFMAETAKILNPEKTVLIPTKAAQCPMAKMVTPQALVKMKAQHPNAAIVSYVNTSAETKAVSDICCTSANAVEIVNSLPNEDVIFVPDKHLANYVQTKTSKRIIAWDGFCYVHSRITVAQVNELKRAHPSAKLLVHPECPLDVIKMADYVCSTSQMMKNAKEDPAREFIVVTEQGMAERLRLEIPEKEFHQLAYATCIQQKKNTLPLVLLSLQDNVFKVEIEKNTMDKARVAIERMLDAK
jgi:quinolinate synthase